MFLAIFFALLLDPATVAPKPKALTDAQKLSIARMEIAFLQKRAEGSEAELSALKKRDQAREEMSAIAAEFAKRIEAIAGRPGCTTTAEQELDCPAPPTPQTKPKEEPKK